MSVTPPPAARLQAPRCSRRLGPPAQWARFRAAVRAATSARLAQLWALRGACPFSLPRNVPPFSGRGAGLQTGLIAPPSRGVRKSPQASGFGGFQAGEHSRVLGGWDSPHLRGQRPRHRDPRARPVPPAVPCVLLCHMLQPSPGRARPGSHVPPRQVPTPRGRPVLGAFAEAPPQLAVTSP